MLPRQGGVRLLRWRTSRGSLTVVLGASRLWQYQNNLDVCGWCDEEQMTTSCDVELMLKMLPVEDVLVRELFLSLVRLPNFFVIWNELSNLAFSRSTILFRFFFRCGWTVPPLLEHKVLRFLYSSVEISFVAVWRSLLRHPCLSCVAGNPSFNGVASPNHLSLSFTWCSFSRSPFPFLYLVQLFWKNLSRVWPF